MNYSQMLLVVNTTGAGNAVLQVAAPAVSLAPD